MQSFGGPRRERLMITSIDLENFLSIPGCQKIGPFHKKFSVRQLNDGGSNSLFDALLFVFGKRAKRSELNKTSDLIHRSTRYPNMEYCRVSVHFQLIIDDEDSEEVYEVITNSEFVVTRVAYLNGETEYMLDNRSSRITDIGLIFMQYGLDLNDNSYLFLHGDVSKIEMMRPKATSPQELGILDIMEEIFGAGVSSQDSAVEQGRIATPYNDAGNSEQLELYERQSFSDPSQTNLQYNPQQQITFEPEKEGQTGMQRLVDKVINEFQQSCDVIQVSALDGNGDSFQVYNGAIRSLSAFHLANVLRHPSCFYFFSASGIPNDSSPDLEDSVMQRDICWMTDPAPPLVQARSHNTISASWPFVSFCGISPPAYVDTVQYILEIAQGVEYKPGYFTRFISDVCAIDYRTVCAGPNLNSTTIQGLLPARWYHLRLSIEYLGQRFVSESQSIHTPTWMPSTPGVPRVNVLPVLSSFDLQSDVPVRLEMIISWNPSSANGQPITNYQCHIQKFNRDGNVIQSHEAIMKKEKHRRNRVYYHSPERDPRANQWTQSPGRSALQIHNSIVLGERSPTRGRTAQARNSSLASSSGGGGSTHSPGKLPNVHDGLTQHPLSTEVAPEQRRFKWEIIYDSILTSVKCSSPESDQAEWHIRVRARNANGWSDFSPVLKISGLTHPSLFSLPPPVYAYGTCYYAEHSAQYLDGSEAEEFRRSSSHSVTAAPESSNHPSREDGGNRSSSIKNELFLLSRKTGETGGTGGGSGDSPSGGGFAGANMSSKYSQKEKKQRQKPSSMMRREDSAKSVSSLGGGYSGKTNSTNNNNMNNGSAKSGVDGSKIQQHPPKLHVLHFKEGNNWEGTSSSMGSLSLVGFPDQQSSPATTSGGNRKHHNESLPSLNSNHRANSGRGLFTKG